jgi:hypothetical protein
VPLLHDPLYWYRQSLAHQHTGVFAAFSLYWILPIIACLDLIRRHERVNAAVLLLPVFCAYLSLFVAFDVTRMMTLAFPTILIATDYVLRANATQARRWLLILGGLNFLLPQFNVAGSAVDVMSRH